MGSGRWGVGGEELASSGGKRARKRETFKRTGVSTSLPLSSSLTKGPIKGNGG